MAEPFKNNFNHQNITQLGQLLANQLPQFDLDGFVDAATDQLEQQELKQRSWQITSALHQFMPSELEQSYDAIEAILSPVDESSISWQSCENTVNGWIVMPICDYAAENAIAKNEIEQGLAFQATLTKRFSAEFSIRKFIQLHPEQTIVTMLKWTQHPSTHVRRLASEGCRPRLPWGQQLKSLIDDPAPILPILESLMNDKEEYVRRSVANNLNDISKDHPELFVSFVENWWEEGNSVRTKLLKHAARGLVKAGHPGVLNALGVKPFKGKLIKLTLNKDAVCVGDRVDIELQLQADKTSKAQTCVLDYVLYYQKANGSLKPKVFKWANFTMEADEKKILVKSHHFREVTTRKHYAGEHKVAIQINGEELDSVQLELKKA